MTDNQKDLITKAMRKAFQLGQTYWQQADSEYFSQNKKADDTYNNFQISVEVLLEDLNNNEEFG